MMLGMLFWNIVWLVLLALLIWGAVAWLKQRSVNSPPHIESRFSALEILRQRYARGEIDDATFMRMRERLGEDLKYPVMEE